MTRRVLPLVPILTGCSALAVGFSAIVLRTIFLTGHWYYPLDDTYIGMSIARHLALHGVWGTSSQFASATSTPGFVALLAICYRLTGVSQYTPLVLTFLACIGTIFATASILRGASSRLQIIGICLVVVLTPLWTMAALGMEHALQIFLCLVFLDLLAPAIAFHGRLNWRVLVIAALMVSVRYEGLFVVAGACLLLLLQKRWRAMLVLCAAAWLPVLAFGFFFRLHGGLWLPNSVLLKGGAGIDRIFGFLYRGFYLAPLMLLVTWIAWRNRRANSSAKAAIGITTVALWLHFLFADYGWCYRYEAYLIALGIASLALCYREGLLSTAAQYVALFAIGILFVHALPATVTLPGRSRAIYMQQLQTAKLLTFYSVPTALNDIGSPTYFTGAPVLDVVGLGSQDVFNARYKRPYTTEVLDKLLTEHHIQTIAIYDDWFPKHPGVAWGGPSLPTRYVKVAELHTDAPSGYLGGNTVSYYAAPVSETNLRAALHKLEAVLPAGDSIHFEK